MDYAALVAELTSRWPEHRIGRSLARVAALANYLGDPQDAAPVIQVAGTNGKGSTCIMIDSLLRAVGLRTGRFASPHLSDARERICTDGEPISRETFLEVWEQVAPYVGLVDQQQLDGIAMTFFEVITGMAYAAFADAPVDVAVVEVGLGGAWDATSICSPAVAVVAPIGADHTHILGESLTEIATEKAGIIKPGSTAVIAGQEPEAIRPLLARAVDVGAVVKAEGPDFSLLDRRAAVGGQVIRIQTTSGPVGDLFLPRHGAHMARNAALAVAAVEAFLGDKPLAPEIIEQGLADVKAPARLELVRTSPAVVVDTAHNPQAARVTVDACLEAFAFEPTIGVVAMMTDKDAAGVLETFAEVMDQVIVTQAAGTSRAMPTAELASLAEEIWPSGKVHQSPTIADALELATLLADAAGPASGVLVAGSLIAAGQARDLLVGPLSSDQPSDR